VTQNSAALRVGDAEDQAALAEKEAIERVSIAEARNTVVLVSSREVTEGLVWKITLLEDDLAVERRAQEVSKRERQAQFQELTLL
jgi:hypothetical protein